MYTERIKNKNMLKKSTEKQEKLQREVPKRHEPEPKGSKVIS